MSRDPDSKGKRPTENDAPDAGDEEREARLAAMRDGLDVGIAELDAGLGVETSPDELMAEISAELGLAP